MVGLELLILETPDFIPTVAVAAQQSGSNSCGLYCMGRAPGVSLQGEDPDCGGDAAAHCGGVGTPRPACHQQRSESLA